MVSLGWGPCASASIIREHSLGSISYGNTDKQISAAECEDCETDACSGFAFVDQAGSIYFFDLPGNALKKITGALSGGASVLSIPGPPRTAENEAPYDGCVGPDGTVYLLADKTTLSDRFLIYARGPAEPAWQLAEPLDDQSIGWADIGGRHSQVSQSARIVREPEGSIAVFDAARDHGEALVVAQAGRLLRKPDRVRLAAKTRVASRHGLAEGVVSKLPPGRFLGTDASGRSYQVVWTRGDAYVLQCYDGAGRVVASAPLPRRRNAKLMLGKGSMFVAPTGGVVEAGITASGLQLSHWSVED